MSDLSLRKHLADMLTQPNAHLLLEDTVDIPPEKAGTVPAGFTHSAWQILEHVRICQWDIIQFCINDKHISPDFPDGYWPQTASPPTETAWQESISSFKQDYQQMIDLVSNTSHNLFAPFAHGDGQTLLREVILLLKHNSYHIGQLAQLKAAFDKNK